ncbi:RNA exonuclease 3 [Gamsiella multidivaricata]|nr:RNA exonuclease 3 [Gamsiella multidivaricata]
MFASSGLFTAIPCPFTPTCPRESFCFYSHIPVPEAETARTAKRKLDNAGSTQDATKEAILRPAKQNRVKSQSEEKAVKETSRNQPPISAVEAARRRRQALDTTSTLPSSSSLGVIAGSKSSAVLLARPDVASASSFKKASALGSTISGPPVLKIDLRAHSKPQFRQAVAMQYYSEFCRIYAPLSDVGANTATVHAIEQEKAVHSKTNQGSYRSLAATILQRLKKRPLTTGEDDIGIDGVWVDPTLKSKEISALDESWRGASKYVQTLEQLEANGYPITLPTGAPVPLDDSQICDRCQKKFVRKDALSDEDKQACFYHELRLRTKKVHGEKIRVFPCCEAGQGSLGCKEGAHVFKEDDFLSLHSRIPFIETPRASSSGGQKTHAVVAMDCEMCYTTGGFELIRISVVDIAGKPIMDELVKPKQEVLDLNSRFSGITSLSDAKYSLEQARSRFLELINRDTIIIGQSLENDFKVLRLIHTRVIDTAMLYLHPQHLQNYRYSLQSLAREHLRVHIQDSEEGHDSFEDAKTCLDLVRLKIAKDIT